MADTLLASGDPAVTLQALIDILGETNPPPARIPVQLRAWDPATGPGRDMLVADIV